jgi:hypothetical protein
MNNKRAKNKRGLSSIVTTLIIIVLSLVAVGGVWVVVSNVLKSGTQQASFQFGTLFLDLKIDKVLFDSNGNPSILVSRGNGDGDLSAIDFIISDGTNSQVIKKTTSLSPLGSQTFTFTSSDLGNIGIVKEISIAPVINSGGTDQIGSKVDTKNFETLDIIKNIGGVSWWKLNGNANDELGNNNGNVIGNVNFVSGKSGQAASFSGSNDGWIKMNSFTNLPMGNSPRTMLAWIKPTGYVEGTYGGIVAYSGEEAGHTGSLLSIKNDGRLSQAFWGDDTYQAGTPATLNNWNQVAFTYSGGITIKFYMNGVLADTESLSVPAATTSTGAPPRIGCTDIPGRCFQGQIEDVMIFNRELTANQISGLYNLDLSK